MSAKIVVTTADLKEDYEVLEVVTAHKRMTHPRIFDKVAVAKVNAMLRSEAKILDADAVVGVGYTIERTEKGASVLGFGTAVRRRK